MEKTNLHTDSETFLAQWLAGELTDKELKDLVSEADYVAFLKLKKGLDISEQLNASTDDSFAKIQNRISRKTTKVRPLNTRWAIGIAASIIVLLGVFSFLNTSEINVVTGYGEQKTIALLDGTEVILNANSRLIYDEDNWDNERKLSLEGEAYFKVTKGETFVVETEHGSVTVLGTQFNVNAAKNYFDVVCYEGKVGVKTYDSEHILLPEDGVRKVDGYHVEHPAITDKMPTWIHGESTFKSVPLYQVIKALEDQYQIRFDTDYINRTEIFTGSFPHDSLDIALKTVFQTLNISYNEKEKRNIKLRYKE